MLITNLAEDNFLGTMHLLY